MPLDEETLRIAKITLELRDSAKKWDETRRLVEARMMLRNWANAHSHRDAVVRAALTAGITPTEIQRVTGIARTTIARIAQAQVADGQDQDRR